MEGKGEVERSSGKVSGEAERSSGKVSGAAASKKSVRMNKKLSCRYCNKKFNNHQALGGHQNAHKTERAAAHKEKVLGMASAYAQSPYVPGFVDSNKFSGFHSKTLGVSASSMTRFKPHPQPYIQFGYNLCLGYYTLNHVETTIHKLETLVDEGNRFHHVNKSYQPITFPILKGGTPNSNLGSCDKEIFWQANNSSMISQNAIIKMPDLNLKLSIDNENSDEENNFSLIPNNRIVEELDLTLKI